MPDKQGDSRFFAMLERRGIVRKAGSNDEQPEAEFAEEAPRPDAKAQTLYSTYEGDMDYSTDFEIQKGEQPQIMDNTRTDQFRPVEFSNTDLYASEINAMTNYSQQKDIYSATDLANVAEYRPQPLVQVEEYTDRYVEIEDLYRILSIKSKKTDTIYLIEDYLSSLPESLPDESRREIVSKIVAASGFDYDLLMGDGVLRVKMLKEYAERFARHTDDYVAACQSELEALDQQILRVRALIEERRELHKKQFFTIEAEAQRLKDILTFISG